VVFEPGDGDWHFISHRNSPPGSWWDVRLPIRLVGQQIRQLPMNRFYEPKTALKKNLARQTGTAEPGWEQLREIFLPSD